MRILFLGSIFLLLTAVRGTGQVKIQNDYLADSLKKDLSLAKTDAQKAHVLADLADFYMGINNELSADYGRQAISVAELSRDRKLIAQIHLAIGIAYINMGNLQDKIALALENFQYVEKISRENGLDEELAYCYTGLSRVYRSKGEYGKALNYNNLALSIGSGSGNDSLKVTAYNSMGNTYLTMNEKLLAFRNYLEALNVAELSKRDDLLILSYGTLTDFYGVIKDYDKAIDYLTKTMAINRKDNKRYQILNNYNGLGLYFAAKKQESLALHMYEEAISLADSLHFPTYNLNSYLGIANMYFRNNEMARGMQYLNDHKEILDFFFNSGMGFFIYQGYGSIYTGLGKYDSAYYFFKKAEPDIEGKTNSFRKNDFYTQFAEFYKLKGDNKNAIVYFQKARKIGIEVNDIGMQQVADQNLDTLYGKTGDFKTAYFYNLEYNRCTDSLRAMSSESDRLNLEVNNDNRRRDRLAREEEENKVRRENIQYMGLAAGLAGLFILLVMAGLFVVSPRTIRALGFFSFIFLFEFIILIADKQIHEWTHGEPWKILLIKIFLAAILLPLHHWLEHKVIHYLTSRRKFAGGLSFSARGIKKETGVSPGHG